MTRVAAAGSTTPVMITSGGHADAYTLTGVPDLRRRYQQRLTAGSLAVALTYEHGVRLVMRYDNLLPPQAGRVQRHLLTFVISQSAAGAANRTIRLTPYALQDLPAAGSTETVMVASWMRGDRLYLTCVRYWFGDCLGDGASNG